MSENMRVVECDSPYCDHTFEISESCIKTMVGTKCILHEKVECLKCNKKTNMVRDLKLIEEAKTRNIVKASSPISCPRCNSTQLYASDKGFSAGKALAGSVVAGGVGLLAGFHDSKKVMLTCLSCSHKWEVGK